MKLPDWSEWPRVELAGVTYAVAPRYVHGVGIGEAVTLAKQMGTVLPWPALVDAIYAAAECKIDATSLPRSERGPAMASVAVIADQAARIQRRIDAWESTHGRAPRLVAGTHKDVVRTLGGQLGLYGWQRADGRLWQSFFAGHGLFHADYSQGLRLVLPLDADGSPRR